MPLTSFQTYVAQLLARNRSPESHLAGGSAIHLDPNSERYSNDLDYFHDAIERVAEAFEADHTILVDEGCNVTVDMSQPGYIRAFVEKGLENTKIEWAHDSAWRFLPTVFSQEFGYVLHPIDLAINKVLTLAGRNEVRDFIDVLHCHRKVLPLGGQCWAAAGKDPGFTPLSLLELLRRRGRYREEEIARLHLARPIDLPSLKTEWLSALDAADRFIRSRPPQELGCLYYSPGEQTFVEPSSESYSTEPDAVESDAIPHFGRPGGVIPRIIDSEEPVQP